MQIQDTALHPPSSHPLFRSSGPPFALLFSLSLSLSLHSLHYLKLDLLREFPPKLTWPTRLSRVIDILTKRGVLDTYSSSQTDWNKPPRMIVHAHTYNRVIHSTYLFSRFHSSLIFFFNSAEKCTKFFEHITVIVITHSDYSRRKKFAHQLILQRSRTNGTFWMFKMQRECL